MIKTRRLNGTRDLSPDTANRTRGGQISFGSQHAINSARDLKLWKAME
jgi:hypothetical protein